jgi:hypothetical protein
LGNFVFALDVDLLFQVSGIADLPGHGDELRKRYRDRFCYPP